MNATQFLMLVLMHFDSVHQLSYRPQYGIKLGRERSLSHTQIEHFGNQGFQLLIWKPKMGIEWLTACSIVA